VFGAWQVALAPLDATHHLLGPIDVELRDEQAVAQCHVQAYHRARSAPGGTEWTVAGHYVFTLVRQAAAWKIRKLVLQVSYQTGNAQLLAEAGRTAER
jgi:hypothetical protein